jgi:phosphoribosylamine--glycine ligase
MKYLVIGSGGREHALGWELAREEESEVCFLPGNGGTPGIGPNIDVSPADTDAVVAEVERLKPGLVVVGPEDPLAMGIVDRLLATGVPVFGPTAACARLESSKIFAKTLMSRYSIPTASYEVFDSAREAHEYIDRVRKRLVVKADGLAKGKGSIVTKTRKDAHRAVEDLMVKRIFGEAGDRIVIEDRLKGEEASVIAVVDGEHYVLFPPAQDHKAAYDGDRGPNTGGMGAYCPAVVMDEDLIEQVRRGVFDRLLAALRKEGLDYRGVIYAGLMINATGFYVVEFNVRFGDPETQCTLPALDVDLGPMLLSAARGRLGENRVLKAARWAVSVVLASGGYPGIYETGKVMEGLESAGGDEDVVVFHAGTQRESDGSLVTSGGRVLAVTGVGETLRSARRKTYNAVRHIRFEDKQMRTDIGAKGLARAGTAGVI